MYSILKNKIPNCTILTKKKKNKKKYRITLYSSVERFRESVLRETFEFPSKQQSNKRP